MIIMIKIKNFKVIHLNKIKAQKILLLNNSKIRNKFLTYQILVKIFKEMMRYMRKILKNLKFI